MNDQLDQDHHLKAVERWLDSISGFSASDKIKILEECFARVQGRATRCLSDVTVLAVFDRIQLKCGESHPIILHWKIEASGILIGPVPELVEEILPAARCFLINTFVIFSNLTSDILTDALHDELKAVDLTKYGRPHEQ